MMDAVEFLKEKNRMCNSFDDCCKDKESHTFFCELHIKLNETRETCAEYIKNHPEEAVVIVEKWSKAHPRKTRQSEFLKMFPDAKVFKGTLAINPCVVVNSLLNTEECHMLDQEGNLGCYKCREKFWSEEVDDGHD